MSADVFMLSDVKCTTHDAPWGKVHGCFHRCEKAVYSFHNQRNAKYIGKCLFLKKNLNDWQEYNKNRF